MLPCRYIGYFCTGMGTWTRRVATVRTIQESTHHMKKEAKDKKGAVIATAATENCDLPRSQHHCWIYEVWLRVSYFTHLIYSAPALMWRLECDETRLRLKLIARNGSNVCPVAILEWYIAMANLTPAGKNWLFQPMATQWTFITANSQFPYT